MENEQKMTKSLEVLTYLKKNLNKNNCISLFYAGSIPEELIPQSDLDIYYIIKNSRKNHALDELSNMMNKFISEHNGVTYSFYRGPIKYKNKGLVHFLIYLENQIEGKSRQAFSQENKPVLKSISSSAVVLLGKHPKELLEEVVLDDNIGINKSMDSWKKKRDKLLKHNRIYHPSWKKIDGEWDFVRVYKTPSNFLRAYLLKYYEKHIK
jgi:hypothetical protein